jgi:hypothetical protein
MKQQCKNCWWWNKWPSDPIGDCFRIKRGMWNEWLIYTTKAMFCCKYWKEAKK